MESIAGLRCSALPNIPSLRIPSCFHSARATKPQLSLSHSALSLPRTFEGRPLHRPVSCVRYGSLHRGTENVPLTAFFPWNFSRIHCSKGKADETSMECPSNQKGTDEDRRSQQIQDSVKCQQQCYLYGHATVDILEKYLTCLKVNAKDRVRAYQQLHDDIMTVVKALQTAGNHDVAVKILKAYEPLAATYDGGQALELVELELMKSLQALGKYREAFEYWLQLCNKSSPYLKIVEKLQYDLSLAVMTEVSNCLKKGIGEEKVPSDLLKNIGDTVKTLESLKAQDNPGSLPSTPPDDLTKD